MDKKKIVILIVAGIIVASLIAAACFLFAGNNKDGSSETTNVQTQDGNENIKFDDSVAINEDDVVIKVGKQTMDRDLFSLYVNLAGYSSVSAFYSAGHIESLDNFSWDDPYTDGGISTTYNGLARDMALEALIPVLAIIDQGVDFGILWEDADEKMLRSWFDEQKKGFGENFEEYLKKGGYGNEEIFYEYYRLQSHRDKIYEDIEGNLEKYADLKKLEDYTKDTITANHILIMFDGAKESREVTAEDKASTRADAEAVLARLKAGEDFETLRKELSEDPGATDEGYTFNKNGELNDGSGGILYPQFAEGAFALKVGEISGLIETDYGFHIIKRMERKVTLVDYIEYLRDTAPVQVNKPVFDQINVQIDMKDYYTGEEKTAE